MERNVRLLLSYDGTEFHGWQSQPGLRTVQDVITQSVRRVVRHLVHLTASGRTDAGVHAAGQVANFSTDCLLSMEKMRSAVGSRLPKDVSVRGARVVSAEFHARRSTESKLYRYRIHNTADRPVSHLAQNYCYHFWDPLDVDRMQEAAVLFVGTMDFRAMAAAGCERETMVRTILRCDVHRHLDEVRIDVEGTGFLYNQVRNMVGTMIEVGRGRWAPEYVSEILAGGDRSKAGPTAPARGLCLQWVRYPAELLWPDGAGAGRASPTTAGD